MTDKPPDEQPAGRYRSRIIGSGTEDPEQLLAHPANWRIHPKFQQDALAGILDEIGWVQQVIVNQRTGFLLDGHLRVTLALRENEPSIPVVYVDLSEEEEAKVLATIDPLGAIAVTDSSKLDALLGEISTGNESVEQLLASLAEPSTPIPDPGDFPDGEQNTVKIQTQVSESEHDACLIAIRGAISDIPSANIV